MKLSMDTNQHHETCLHRLYILLRKKTKNKPKNGISEIMWAYNSSSKNNRRFMTKRKTQSKNHVTEEYFIKDHATITTTKINTGSEISAPEWLIREPVMAAELEHVWSTALLELEAPWFSVSARTSVSRRGFRRERNQLNCAPDRGGLHREMFWAHVGIGLQSSRHNAKAKPKTSALSSIMGRPIAALELWKDHGPWPNWPTSRALRQVIHEQHYKLEKKKKLRRRLVYIW